MTTEKIDICDRAGNVLFSADIGTDIPRNLHLPMRAALEHAVKAEADLSGANLTGARGQL